MRVVPNRSYLMQELEALLLSHRRAPGPLAFIYSKSNYYCSTIIIRLKKNSHFKNKVVFYKTHVIQWFPFQLVVNCGHMRYR